MYIMYQILKYEEKNITIPLNIVVMLLMLINRIHKNDLLPTLYLHFVVYDERILQCRIQSQQKLILSDN